MAQDSGTKGTPSRTDEEIKIEDLPNREATGAESEAAKGGYYSGPGGIITLGGFGVSDGTTTHDTDATKKTDPQTGNDELDDA